eukprot:GHRR01003082.1.p1 GENE.GHRR01003082.1~~GHRR01003082.1.p1  ORF type:complete len:224 (+),score=49.83 GHRR01003082.1:267-938(+)
MSAMAKVGRVNTRYLWAKLNTALDVVRTELADPGKAVTSSSTVVQKFQEAFSKQLTAIIAVTGAAMAPAINAEALSNSSAFEKLVVRLIPRPSSRTITIGDVVAFNSPLDPNNQHSMMVRRVAALEGHTMMTTDDGNHAERIPAGHAWVLADNAGLSPPDVIDSRAFGYLDMRLIMGRVIYRIRHSKEHGPVANSPQSEAQDQAIIEGEVDVEELAGTMPSEQ